MTLGMKINDSIIGKAFIHHKKLKINKSIGIIVGSGREAVNSNQLLSIMAGHKNYILKADKMIGIIFSSRMTAAVKRVWWA